MDRDRIKWNDKYLKREPITTPSRIVENHIDLSPVGRALDIAAGTGRNAIFLAEHGFSVEAVDISEVGLRQLAGRHPNVSPICADLDIYEIHPNRYNLILNIRFCHRRLFPLIIEGLAPAGMLIFEGYLVQSEKKGDGPTCRDYLLRENELLHAFLALNIIYYREGTVPGRKSHSQAASLVALKKG